MPATFPARRAAAHGRPAPARHTGSSRPFTPASGRPRQIDREHDIFLLMLADFTRKMARPQYENAKYFLPSRASSYWPIGYFRHGQCRAATLTPVGRTFINISRNTGTATPRMIAALSCLDDDFHHASYYAGDIDFGERVIRFLAGRDDDAGR